MIKIGPKKPDFLAHFQRFLYLQPLDSTNVTNLFLNNTTLLNLWDMFCETIHIISKNTISKIHNISSQHNALLQSLLKCFIKKFS